MEREPLEGAFINMFMTQDRSPDCYNQAGYCLNRLWPLHSLFHALIHSPTRPRTHSLSHSLTPSPTHSATQHLLTGEVGSDRLQQEEDPNLAAALVMS